jgi:hypothetical protein
MTKRNEDHIHDYEPRGLNTAGQEVFGCIYPNCGDIKTVGEKSVKWGSRRESWTSRSVRTLH